ncbi:MAG: kelch repeat-containing protein [Betaproteobacteria bacterium]|nr:kelch repeat-containing protein [Betaproteobacteria bacterium]
MDRWIALAALTLGALGGIPRAANAALPFPNLPTNQWVPVRVTCRGGLASYFNGCPAPRGWLQLAYDTRRHRVVMFGGSGGWYYNDLWQFNPLTRVWRLKIQDTRLAGEKKNWAIYPKGRDNHEFVYDPVHDVFWMYGGTGGGGFWKLNASTDAWTRMPGRHDGKSLPNAALDPGFALDAADNEILLFGGERASYYDGTWLFNTQQQKWEHLHPSISPPARAQTENAMVYDPDDKEFILFGGLTTRRVLLNDTWVFKVGSRTWVQMHPRVSPPPRDRHMMVYDEADRRVILWGGAPTADTWVYDPRRNTWQEVRAAQGSYNAALSPKAAGVYCPDLDLTVYRDLSGQVYFFRLDLSTLNRKAAGNPRW